MTQPSDSSTLPGLLEVLSFKETFLHECVRFQKVDHNFHYKRFLVTAVLCCPAAQRREITMQINLLMPDLLRVSHLNLIT